MEGQVSTMSEEWDVRKAPRSARSEPRRSKALEVLYCKKLKGALSLTIYIYY